MRSCVHALLRSDAHLSRISQSARRAFMSPIFVTIFPCSISAGERATSKSETWGLVDEERDCGAVEPGPDGGERWEGGGGRGDETTWGLRQSPPARPSSQTLPLFVGRIRSNRLYEATWTTRPRPTDPTPRSFPRKHSPVHPPGHSRTPGPCTPRISGSGPCTPRISGSGPCTPTAQHQKQEAGTGPSHRTSP